MNVDYNFKIVLLGDSCVGKTQIISRITKDTFDQSSTSTVSFELSSKLLKINDKIVKLILWDATDLPSRLRLIIKSLLKNSNAIILVYDVTSKRSFQLLDEYSQIFQQYRDQNVFVMLAANKIDDQQHRQIQKIQGLELAAKKNYGFIEVSAKQNINIDQLFDQITYHLISVSQFQIQVQNQKQRYKRHLQQEQKMKIKKAQQVKEIQNKKIKNKQAILKLIQLGLIPSKTKEVIKTTESKKEDSLQ